MELRWHPYRYYPYERELAHREISSLLSPEWVVADNKNIQLEGCFNTNDIERLVYFAEALEGEQTIPTLQARLERVNGNGLNRQSTRYSVHGLHEYKGKFNPQMVRAILNILRVPSGARILDPFCGSGTSLVECAHMGMQAMGTDINPLAVFIANAKLSALRLPASILREGMASAIKRWKTVKVSHKSVDDERIVYLKRWFDQSILDEMEKLRISIERGIPETVSVLLTLASNLLRDYSLQDPQDLRIRRRKSPLPEMPFIEAFEKAVNIFISRLEDAQETLGQALTIGEALLLDSREMKCGDVEIGTNLFDCALTSPPYATALPYIDTQRLSLVWLKLLNPSDILFLESQLLGSREVRGESKKELLSILQDNQGNLPKEQIEYCLLLQAALSDKDGFRRQAVPMLLYRYFVGMMKVFKTMHGCMKQGAPFALIVGSNHTVLSGQRFDIDTPAHLAQIAQSCGWVHEEIFPLQTYQRYGYHMNNAVNSESLIILRTT